jgi:Zn-dependent protease with chaperone function
MNFFEHQAQAHRESKKLLLLFVLAVICIAISVNGVLALVWNWFMHDANGVVRDYPRYFFHTNTALVVLFIGGGSLVETMRLRDGGDAVAQMAGGRLVQPNSRDILERRLLNIVEEMSLASGIACPRVYVMYKEDAINAFAAGYHQDEAVVAVTKGTLTRLNRDELQGVIGHEFSHILNGDMRMNIKLIGVLFGIQMLSEFGRFLIEGTARFGSSKSSEKGASIHIVLLVTGAAFFVIGYIGIFFGRLIKSAVSRQREYLADASAVQFTRNLDGIGGALRKIGGLTRTNRCGSRIENIHAEQFSHMFLGAAKPSLLSGFFATHPPIEIRLKKLYGQSVEFFSAGELPLEEDVRDVAVSNGAMGFAAPMPMSSVAQSISPTAFHPRFGYAATELENKLENKLDPEKFTALQKESTHIDLPELILNSARNPFGACELVFALFLDAKDDKAYQTQQLILHQAASKQALHAIALFELLETLPRSLRLPLLDLSMPALKLLTVEQRHHLLGVVSRLIAADQKLSQSEFVLQVVLQRRLSKHAGRAVPIRYVYLSLLKNEVALLLSLMTHTIYSPVEAKEHFINACALMPDLDLHESGFIAKESIDLFEVKLALDKLNQLAPLAKPFLIRLLMQVQVLPMKIGSADLLRGICAAIEAPIPEAVSATYGVYKADFEETFLGTSAKR